MEVSRRTLASLVLLLGFTGCSTTTAYIPQGMTPKQAEHRLNDVRFACRTIRLGEPVTVSFYPGGKDASAQDVQQGLKGYFYAFNRMTDTVYISHNPLTLFDRGEPYDLQYVQNMAPTNPVKPAIPLVLLPDYEQNLLTQ